MKKIFLVGLVSLSYFMVGCMSVPHRSEGAVSKTEEGKNQVRIELHSDDPTEIGSQINAMDKKCRRGSARLGAGEICSYSVKGTGRIISVNEKQAVVEFPSNVQLNAETLFESVVK